MEIMETVDSQCYMMPQIQFTPYKLALLVILNPKITRILYCIRILKYVHNSMVIKIW